MTTENIFFIVVIFIFLSYFSRYIIELRYVNYRGIKQQLLLILKNQKTMSEALDAIKSDLVATKAIVIKVKADVEGLHAKLDALGDAPTPEQLAEVKALSADLVTSLQAVDDETEDAPQINQPPVEG